MMSNSSIMPKCARRKILPCNSSCPPANLTPKRLSSRWSNAGPSIPAGKQTAVIPSAGRAANISSPSACMPARVVRGQPRRPRPHRFDALGADQLASDSARPSDQRRGRRPGRVRAGGAVQLVAVKFQVEVKRLRFDALDLPPGLLADRQKRQPRRRHQRLLRTDDQHVDVPGVGQTTHRAGAADGVDNPQRRRCRPPLADGLDVVPHARAALHQRAEHGHRVGVLLQLSRPRRRARRPGPRAPRGAQRRCHSGGRCRPIAARTRRDSSTIALPPRGTRFDHRRFHRAGARAGQHQHVVFVCKTYFSPESTSANTARNSAVR